VRFVIAEPMHHNGVALHAANGMFNEDTSLTQDLIPSLLLTSQFRVGILFAFARLFRWEVNLFTFVIRLNT
jgi:hypothetical protein